MSVTLKPGARLRSRTDTTEVVVVRGNHEIDLRCGGAPMVAADGGAPDGTPAVGLDAGTQLGKRYATDDIELLCTKAGPGSLSVGDTPIGIKDPKPLPASD